MPAATDPAPRSYPPSVTLVRRAAGGPATAPRSTSPAETERWLLTDALREDDLLALFECFVWRLVAAGLPLDRASLHVGTLHPQLYGFAWNWARADGLLDEVKVAEAALKTDAYRRNPLFHVIEHGRVFDLRPDDPEVAAQYPLMAELAGQGITEYVAMPLRAGGAYHNAATFATAQAGGFESTQRDALERLSHLFALHVERHIALHIAANVLDTYLGHAAGARVLKGTIKRGAGEAVHAILWASDMRGFTDLADKLDGPPMIALLNAYFERLVGAVMAHRGEVLKFIGDGLLAAFPFGAFASEREAAQASLRAAAEALASVESLNAAPPAELAAIPHWRPLKSGIALHEGTVFFGNVGAPERLDFTVIGRAVNAAARVESLSKALGRPILLTQDVARHLDVPLEHLGEHHLRGLAEPVALYSPAA